MKAEILKIAGVKSEKDFYKLFPDEASFMAKHGKALKKAAMGAKMVNKQLKQLTDFGNPPKAQGGDVLPGNCGQDQYWDGTMCIDINPIGAAVGQITDPENFDYQEVQKFNVNKNLSTGTPKTGPGTGVNPQPKKKEDNLMDTVTKYAGPVGDMLEGINQLAEEQSAVKRAKQLNAVSNVNLIASRTSPEEDRRIYNRPEDMIVNPNQRFPSYGTGTNPLARNGYMIGGNPTEIQNMYSDDDTIYTDLGYEPLNDSSQVKQFQNGGGIASILQQFGKNKISGGKMSPKMYGQLGDMATNLGQSAIGGRNAGGRIGGTAGKAIGNAIVPGIGGAIGGFVGGIAGNLLDRNPQKIKKFQNATMRNIETMGMQQGIQGAMGQYSSFVRNGGNIPSYADGGYMNPEYNPQVIAKFGDMDVSDVQDYASDGLESLRTGGHLRQNQQYAMGGQLKTTWGGYAEPISYNRHMPGTGETVMFKGLSEDVGAHSQRSSNGETGIGVKYGEGGKMTDYAEFGTEQADADVEVEKGEPAAELGDGLVVYGNLIAPGYGGRKFKNIVADLSKKEQKQNKIIEKATEAVNNMKVFTPINITTLNAHKMMIEGANAKLKSFANEKQELATLQSAINDTAEEYGLDADALSRGNTKVDKKSDMYKAMFGKKVPKAQDGKNVIKKLHDVIGISPDTPGYGTDIGKRTAIAYNNWAKDNLPEEYNETDPSDHFWNFVSPRERAKAFIKYYNDDIFKPLRDKLELNSSQPTIGDIKNGDRKVDPSGNTFVYDAETKNWVSDAEWMAKYKRSTTAPVAAAPVTTPQQSTTPQPTTVDPAKSAEVEKSKKVKKFKSEKEANAQGYYTGADGKLRKKSFKTSVTQSENKSAAALPEIPKGQSVNQSSGLYGGVTPEQFEAFKKKHSWYTGWDNFNPNNADDVDKFAKEFNAKAEKIGSKARILPDFKNKTTKVGRQFVSADLAEDKKTDVAKTEEEDLAEIDPPKKVPIVPAEQNKFAPLYNMLQSRLQRPYQESLDPSQLYGEMYSLATNQQEPVQAQLYNPELDTTYDISLQDKLNANQADFNALQRTMGYNPAAQMALAAQKYNANSAVLGEQFRLNQAERSGTYDKNRELINASKLQNLGILDQQYQRQAMAKSNTKATTLSALNSISDKIARNKLENRQFATYSNMFPQYGFDSNMRVTNQGLTFFQVPTVGNTEPVYDKKGNIIGYGPDSAKDVATTTTTETTTAIEPKATTATAKYGGITRKQLRNGEILKSFKNL